MNAPSRPLLRALAALLLLLTPLLSACGDDADGGGSSGGFLNNDNGFVNNDPNDGFVNNDPNNDAPNNDAPNNGVNNGVNNDAPNNDAPVDPCTPQLYAQLDGTWSGTLVTISQGAGVPPQTSETPITLNFDQTDFEPVDNPNCTFTRDQDACLFEPGADTRTLCNTNGIVSDTTSTINQTTDEPDRFGYRSRSQTTTTQNGMVLSQTTTDLTFELELLDANTLRYTVTTATTTPNGLFTSEGVATLRPQ